MPTHLQESWLPHSPETVYAFHDRPGIFERLTPPWEDVEVIRRTPGPNGSLDVGAELELSTPLVGPVRGRVLTRHTWHERPLGFTDVQQEGPFAKWEHQHRFHAETRDGIDGTRMVDRIEWVAPLGPAGKAAEPFVIQPRLNTMFAWRHERVKRDLQRHAEAGLSPMRIAMTGATGLVGRALTTLLETGGHTVVPLKRDRDKTREGAREDGRIFWEPVGKNGQPGAVGPGLEDCDAVVHLAGAPIAETDWDERGKRIIEQSRSVGTETLCRALAKLPPKVLVSTSAVGFYGDRGDEELTEASSPGTGFLAEVGQGWEAGVTPAAEAGWRVAIVRVGLVISANGGLLGPLLPLFRAAGGGPVGSGKQWMPWVHIDDLTGLFLHLLAHEETAEHGRVFNGVAPNPVRNATFSKALGRALNRPAVVPAPAFGVRMVLGREKADELLLAGQRVHPEATLAAGFRYDEPELDDALAFELG